MLVDYEYYSNTYKGGDNIPLSKSQFNELCLNSSEKVNYYTNNRINDDNNDKKVKDTVCEIVDLLFKQETLKQKMNDDKSSIASETVGPHSINYNNKSNYQAQQILSEEELNRKCYQICYINLVHTGLMFRGFRE